MVTRKRTKRRTKARKKATVRRKRPLKRKKAVRRKKTVRRKATVRRKRKTAVKRKTKRKTKSKGKRKASGLTKMTYGLSPALAAVCGCTRATRPQVVKKLWAYIKRNGCQDKTQRRMINPDAKLSKVLGNRSLDMLKMSKHISKHLKK